MLRQPVNLALAVQLGRCKLAACRAGSYGPHSGHMTPLLDCVSVTTLVT
jgi:hypothetical protein